MLHCILFKYLLFCDPSYCLSVDWIFAVSKTEASKKTDTSNHISDRSLIFNFNCKTSYVSISDTFGPHVAWEISVIFYKIFIYEII